MNALEFGLSIRDAIDAAVSDETRYHLRTAAQDEVLRRDDEEARKITRAINGRRV